MAISNNESGSSVRTKLNSSLAKTDLISITLAANLDTIQSTLLGKLDASATAADVNPSGTTIAAALSGKLGTSGTAADVNPAGISIAAALSGKAASGHDHSGVYLPVGGTAADVNVAGTAISGALSGKSDAGHNHDLTYLAIGGTAADVNPAGTSISGALSGKQATISFGTGVLTALGNAVSGAGGLAMFSDIVPPALGNITGLGTGVATALALNTGSAGAPALYDGSLGSPSLLRATLTGAISAAAWTTSGIGLIESARTLTDTSSSGTVAAAYTNVLGGNTINSSNGATCTNYYGTYFKNPVQGSMTLTNKWALGADSANIVGELRLAGLRMFTASYPDLNIFCGTNSPVMTVSAGYIKLGQGASTPYFGFTSGFYSSFAVDLFLARGGSATLQLGLLHATTPTAQTIKAHNVTTGTGASLTLSGGTGSVAGGATILATGSGAARVTVNDTGVGLFAATPAAQQAHQADCSTTHAITDPGDAPADADALREDLVTNVIPSVESALNALGTRINSILTTLETFGLHASA